MASLKSLLNDSIVYGASTIIGRLINFLLIPFYTSELISSSGEKLKVVSEADFGIMTTIYVVIAFLNIIFSFGLETSFFRYTKKLSETQARNITFTLSLCLTLILGASLAVLIQQDATGILTYGHNKVLYMALAILMIDSLCVIPFAWLRQKGHKKEFSLIKLFGILINVVLNIYFLNWCALDKIPHSLQLEVDSWTIEYIFLSNIIANGLMLLWLSKDIIKIRLELNRPLISEIIRYSFPLMLLGLAGMVNEVIDRLMLERILPPSFYPNLSNIEVVGIYGAAYKLSIFITIANQAFRFAAEPFFFKNSGQKDSPHLYAKVLKYYFIFTVIITIGVSLSRNFIGEFLLGSAGYRVGLDIVPILLLANVFLGVYYNQSIWYKLSDKTYFGTIISIIGASITLVLNYIFIPLYGFYACALVTLICYLSMSLLSFIWGHKYYPIPYNYYSLLKYFLITISFIGLSYTSWFNALSHLAQFGLAAIGCILLLVYVILSEKNKITQVKA